MRPHGLWLVVVAATLLGMPAATRAGSDASEPLRFSVRAELRPAGSSADGRFSLAGSARVSPQADSADGRFGLKSALAGCDPFYPSLFQNGFEGP